MGDGSEPRGDEDGRGYLPMLQASSIVCGLINCDATCDAGSERRLCTRVARAICAALELEDR